MGITKFFDQVNHDILMTQVSRVVKDKRVLQLIGRFLRAGIVLPEGCQISSEEGTPQGGPLSPLLANIYLEFRNVSAEPFSCNLRWILAVNCGYDAHEHGDYDPSAFVPARG